MVSEHKRTDSDIAAATQSAITWDVYVPETVTAKVENGTITLEGQVTWNYERDAAERAALQRQATADAKSIHVDTSGGKVTLTEHASSWQSITDASNAAWAAPGVDWVTAERTLDTVTACKRATPMPRLKCCQRRERSRSV